MAQEFVRFQKPPPPMIAVCPPAPKNLAEFQEVLVNMYRSVGKPYYADSMQARAEALRAELRDIDALKNKRDLDADLDTQAKQDAQNEVINMANGLARDQKLMGEKSALSNLLDAFSKAFDARKTRADLEKSMEYFRQFLQQLKRDPDARLTLTEEQINRLRGVQIAAEKMDIQLTTEEQGLLNAALAPRFKAPKNTGTAPASPLADLDDLSIINSAPKDVWIKLPGGGLTVEGIDFKYFNKYPAEFNTGGSQLTDKGFLTIWMTKTVKFRFTLNAGTHSKIVRILSNIPNTSLKDFNDDKHIDPDMADKLKLMFSTRQGKTIPLNTGLRSAILGWAGKGLVVSTDARGLSNRLKILVAERQAGNTSAKLRTEGLAILDQLHAHKKITPHEYASLYDLLT